MTNTEFKAYIADRLTDLGFNPEIVLGMYAEEHRFYHTIDHVIYILKKMDEVGLMEKNVYFLSAVFHDAYYNPTADIGFNEIKSNEIFLQMAKSAELDTETQDIVSIIILESDTRKTPSVEESKQFREFDLGIFDDKFSKLIDTDYKIFKEYQHVDWKIYQEKRIEFLKTMDTKRYPRVKGLIEYIKSWKPKIAVYPGTFNPFHKGHYDILTKAEQIFDKVIIAAGTNLDKSNMPSPSFPDSINHRQKEIFTNLLTDFIDDLGYDVTVVSGLRNSSDFEYNLESFYFHQDSKSNIKWVNIFPDRNLRNVSSTNIRTLQQFEKDSKYLMG